MTEPEFSVSSSSPSPPLPPEEWTGAKRIAGFIGGCVSLVLGVIGILMPIMPATPFLLLAAILFLRSSPDLHHRLARSRVLGRPFRDWEQRHGIVRRDRIVAIVVVIVCGGTSLVIVRPGWPLTLLAIGLLGTGLAVILCLPSARDER